MKYNLSYILKIFFIVIIIGVIVYACINLFVFLLPFILIGILLYFLYQVFLKAKLKLNWNKKNNNISEAEVISERFDK